MEQPNIPAEVLERIGDAAIDAASAYSPDHSFGHIAREYYRKGRIDEYLHSLQQLKEGDYCICNFKDSAMAFWFKPGQILQVRTVHTLTKTPDKLWFVGIDDSEGCYANSFTKIPNPIIEPAGPVWVKASDRLPDDTITKAARFRYPNGDYTYSSLTVEDDRIFIGEETTWVIKEVPKVVLEYREWLDESPSPRKEIPRPAGEARAYIPEGYDEWCEAHQSYYKEECPECAPLSPRAAADWEKEKPLDENAAVAILTEVMRECDLAFETTGGGTRHYVRDLLLPALTERKVVLLQSNP